MQNFALSSSALPSRLICWFLAALASTALAAPKSPAPNPFEIKFTTTREGTALLNIYRADGTLARRIVTSENYPKGSHLLTWDGLTDDGTKAGPGEYTWKGLFHEGIGLKLRGWVGNGGGLPWATPDGKGGWGGDRGVPSAVAADDKKVYLGWSLADQGMSVIACDLKGGVQWGHRRSEGPSGCKALAVDEGLVYVLGGLEGPGAQGGAIYRLDPTDGHSVPWPDGAIDLKLSSFWPADGKTKPDLADAMSVRHGHIYLSFTSSQFLTILDAKTGAYLQTVVGAAPGMIDIAPTKTELPDAPGKLSDADFAVISLGGGVLGRILFAHDPFWVITSDMAPPAGDVTVTALSVIGDTGKFHPRTAFVGYGAPYHQVQARPLLDTENASWVAGRQGGRSLLGPWQADGLRSIRGVALAADGQLWVAESDAFPKRFSVWDTGGTQGRLTHEFFGPGERGASGSAIDPLDPDLMFAQGCEWRIDRKTGVAKCLGVVTREPVEVAHYGVGENGHAYLVTQSKAHLVDIFERLGDGDYKLRTRIFHADEQGTEVTENATKVVAWADENGDGKIQPDELNAAHTVGGFYSVTQDLAFHVTGTDPDHGEARGLCGVEDWSTCGAPRYDLKKITWLPSLSDQISADRRFALHGLTCRRVDGNQAQLWSLPAIGETVPRSIGSALLLPPIKNVWVVASPEMGWHILTEEGFDLAQFFQSDLAKARWPKSAAPGADLTHVTTPPGGTLAQAIDHKLYLATSDSTSWNLEVTGLDKVKALPGGKITVPAAQ